MGGWRGSQKRRKTDRLSDQVLIHMDSSAYLTDVEGTPSALRSELAADKMRMHIAPLMTVALVAFAGVASLLAIRRRYGAPALV